jgi:hypothetical protein
MNSREKAEVILEREGFTKFDFNPPVCFLEMNIVPP